MSHNTASIASILKIDLDYTVNASNEVMTP